MSQNTAFNRIKREIGIKKCVILDGDVGDVYLNQKKQIVDLRGQLPPDERELLTLLGKAIKDARHRRQSSGRRNRDYSYSYGR